MNRKITIQQYAEAVGKAAGISEQEALELIKVIFNGVVAKLRTGSSVVIPSIGEFSLSKSSAERVIFTPTSSLADAVNAPFLSFSPVELSDDYEEEPLSDDIDEEEEELPIEEPRIEPIIEQPTEISAYEEPEVNEVSEENVEEPAEEISEDLPNEEILEEVNDEMPTTPPPFNPLKAYAMPQATLDEDEELYETHKTLTRSKRAKFLEGMLVGTIVGVAIVVLIYFVVQMFILDQPLL